MTPLYRTIAVVVTHNRKELLKECIQAIMDQETGSQLDILIIDNGSTDGTQDSIRPFLKDERIRYVNTGANLGGAGGFERGVREAAKGSYDFLWMMDDDTIPSKSALEKLIEAGKRLKGFGFLSSLALWRDGSVCTMNVQRKDIARKLAGRELKGRVIPVQFATFVSLFVPMKVVRKVGAPIGQFFIWGDDWEYTRRISKIYKCFVITDSRVIHKTQTNVGCDISNDLPERIQRYRYGLRNDIFVAKREGIKGRIYISLKIIKNIVKIILFSDKEKGERLKVVFSAVRDSGDFHPVSDPI